MEKKFLTVFAVFDKKTQAYLGKIREKIQNNGFVGTQPMDIPFHISLGSFPVEKRYELCARIKDCCKKFKEFELDLNKINSFGEAVAFVEPVVNDEIIRLHKLFDGNYANGFSWHAHATLFIDGNKEGLKKVVEIAKSEFKPTKAKIVGLQMGEFFPTKMILEEDLQKE